MIKNSKGQGLSLNTIVIAAIVLVVLLILVGITTGYFGQWTGKFKLASETSCQGTGGTVAKKTAGCSGDTKEGGQFYDDVKDGEVCCLKKTCEELQLGAHCCTGGTIIRSDYWSCKEKSKAAPNCCS